MVNDFKIVLTELREKIDFQEKLFSLGATWLDGSVKVAHLDAEHFQVTNVDLIGVKGLKITKANGQEEADSCPHPVLTFEEVMALDSTNQKQEYLNDYTN